MTRRAHAVKIAAEIVAVLADARQTERRTSAQLGEAIGVSERQMFRYWSGETPMPLWVAIGVADVLHVDLGETLQRYL